MKQFDVPAHYRSGIIGQIKSYRRIQDPRKKDLVPTILDFGPLTIVLPRHFGFCYGVENAIEISYKAVAENPGKRLFLLSQMIHNPAVNNDLTEQGIRFIMDTEGNQLIPWEELRPDDVVITPAFGTTVETEKKIRELGIEPERYNTTCPFVEKVWKRSSEIGVRGFTVVIHGKFRHEETRATFSHSIQDSPGVIVRNMEEAQWLGNMILGTVPAEQFFSLFEGKFSPGFDPVRDLERIGVVNQTTMLATETQAIADYFRTVMQKKFGDNAPDHFADTRDTLCYATNDNQDATSAVLDSGADIALVIGGSNSSNTAQIAEILALKMPVYFISSADDILDRNTIRHYRYSAREHMEQKNWLPGSIPTRMVITSGASCPDSTVEEVLSKVLSLYPDSRPVEEVIHSVVTLGIRKHG